jgi:hypothetical protein
VLAAQDCRRLAVIDGPDSDSGATQIKIVRTIEAGRRNLVWGSCWEARREASVLTGRIYELLLIGQKRSSPGADAATEKAQKRGAWRQKVLSDLKGEKEWTKKTAERALEKAFKQLNKEDRLSVGYSAAEQFSYTAQNFTADRSRIK